jgi:hypothetical protein
MERYRCRGKQGDDEGIKECTIRKGSLRKIAFSDQTPIYRNLGA